MATPHDDDTSRKLADLSSRVRKARLESGLGPDKIGPASGGIHSLMGMGLRIATELVVSVGLGGVLGWAADNHWDSAPWGLVVGLGVGFASGVMTVYRVVKGAEAVMGPLPKERTSAGKPEEIDPPENG
ncbi:MAG: AtpZ/AtpI family protein [Rhodospirillaceae bacterium]|nr:AtpZ/AtpI family protein [Rhodospirillaceae bacterium]